MKTFNKFDTIILIIAILLGIAFSIYGVKYTFDSANARSIHEQYCINDDLHYIRHDNASCILDYTKSSKG